MGQNHIAEPPRLHTEAAHHPSEPHSESAPVQTRLLDTDQTGPRRVPDAIHPKAPSGDVQPSNTQIWAQGDPQSDPEQRAAALATALAALEDGPQAALDPTKWLLIEPALTLFPDTSRGPLGYQLIVEAHEVGLPDDAVLALLERVLPTFSPYRQFGFDRSLLAWAVAASNEVVVQGIVDWAAEDGSSFLREVRDATQWLETRAQERDAERRRAEEEAARATARAEAQREAERDAEQRAERERAILAALEEDAEAFRDMVRYATAEEVAYAIRVGANVNLRDAYGQTPLVDAIIRGDLAVVRALLAGGADIGFVTGAGWTALMYAAREVRDHDLLDLILDGTDNLGARNTDGDAAVDVARRTGNDLAAGLIAAEHERRLAAAAAAAARALAEEEERARAEASARARAAARQAAEQARAPLVRFAESALQDAGVDLLGFCPQVPFIVPFLAGTDLAVCGQVLSQSMPAAQRHLDSALRGNQMRVAIPWTAQPTFGGGTFYLARFEGADWAAIPALYVPDLAISGYVYLLFTELD